MINTDDCWLFARYLNKYGYGVVASGRSTFLAHRVMYEASKGEIPKGLQIDHLCRVTQCINPEHLEAVTPQVNTLRGNGMGARRAKQTQCVNGHPFDATDPQGYRRCNTCNRLWYHKNKSRARIY